jgi:hypothetical protein
MFMAEMTLGQDAMSAGMRKVYLDALGAPVYFSPMCQEWVQNGLMPELMRIHQQWIGDVEACAKHFANAIEISDRPHELFLYLQQSLPEQLFLLVAHNVDPETMRDKYGCRCLRSIALDCNVIVVIMCCELSRLVLQCIPFLFLRCASVGRLSIDNCRCIARRRYFDNMPACMTDMVEIKKVEGAEDRIVLAKRDIKIGDVIAEEAPFVATFKAHAPVRAFLVAGAVNTDLDD